jgi:hypothetical protein
MVARDVPDCHGSAVSLTLRTLAFRLLHVHPSPRFGVKRLGAGICQRVGSGMRILEFLFPCLHVSPSNANFKLVGEQDRNRGCRWWDGFHLRDFVQREFSNV